MVVQFLGFEVERVFRITNKNLDLSRWVNNLVLLLNLASIEGLNNHRSYDLGLFKFVDEVLWSMWSVRRPTWPKARLSPLQCSVDWLVVVLGRCLYSSQVFVWLITFGCKKKFLYRLVVKLDCDMVRHTKEIFRMIAILPLRLKQVRVAVDAPQSKQLPPKSRLSYFHLPSLTKHDQSQDLPAVKIGHKHHKRILGHLCNSDAWFYHIKLQTT